MTLSSLFLTGLTLMIPFSSVAPKEATTTRPQPTPTGIQQLVIDEGERNNPAYNQFRFNSRRGIVEYIYVDGTYNPAVVVNNTLQPGTYQFDVQYKADEITGRGLWIALVCVTNSCPKLDGTGTVGMNGILHMMNPSYLGTGEKHLKSQFTIGQQMSNNTIVRIFANDGTNVELDFVKFQRVQGANITSLLKNDSFQEQQTKGFSRISKDSDSSPSEIMPSSQAWTGDMFRASFESVIPSMYGGTNVLMVNWPNGVHETSDFVQSKNYHYLQAGKQYSFSMKYFMPKHSIELAQNHFKVYLYNDNGPHQYVVQTNLSQEECDYTSNTNCAFKTNVYNFSPAVTGTYMIQLYGDTRMELFVDRVALMNRTDNQTVWEDTFDSYAAHDVSILTPKEWVFRESWKQAYGMSPPL